MEGMEKVENCQAEKLNSGGGEESEGEGNPWPYLSQFFVFKRKRGNTVLTQCKMCRTELSAFKTSTSNLQKHVVGRKTTPTRGRHMPPVGNAKLFGISQVAHTQQGKMWMINVVFSSSDPTRHDGTQHSWLWMNHSDHIRTRGRCYHECLENSN
ncbi:hypothetical protein NFI96_024171 [Prochilodus magdalenae]|nr:hypothetical protein NFI96_024171 [Prochilodus magdalenae]